MRRWSERSQKALNSLHPDLQWLMNEVLHEVADISLIQGYRGKEAQNEAYRTGRSKLQYPNGNHNKFPSMAVDSQPYPYPEAKEKLWAALAYVAGRAIEIGKQRGLQVRWGGDWNQNGDLTDQRFDDLFHLEIVE